MGDVPAPGRFPDEQALQGRSKSGKLAYESGFAQPAPGGSGAHWTPESFSSLPVKDTALAHGNLDPQPGDY